MVTVKKDGELFEPVDVQKSMTTKSPYEFKYNLTESGYYNLTIQAPGYADLITNSFYYDSTNEETEPTNLLLITLAIILPTSLVIIALLFYYCRK